MRYMVRRPSLRADNSLTSRRTCRCLDTDGCASSSASTISLTDRSLPAMNSRISRRRGSAMALKGSDVVAALGTGSVIHSDIGICQSENNRQNPGCPASAPVTVCDNTRSPPVYSPAGVLRHTSAPLFFNQPPRHAGRGVHMRGAKFVLSAGAALVVGAAFMIPVGPSPELIAANQAAAPLNCNLTQYKASSGLTSALEGDLLTVSWNGQGTSQLRARFAIDRGTPTIRDLSVRRGGGEWAVLGQNLTPEYQVTTGRRRMSNDQANAFASLGIDVTPELLEKHKWYAFWDAPLSIPGYTPVAAGRGRGGQGGGPAAPDANACARTGRNDRRAGRGHSIGVARQAWLQPVSESAGLHRRARLAVCRERRKKFAAAFRPSRRPRARSRAMAAALR